MAAMEEGVGLHPHPRRRHVSIQIDTPASSSNAPAECDTAANPANSSNALAECETAANPANSSNAPEDEAEHGYANHAKRLKTYTKTAIEITLILFTTLSTKDSDKKYDKIFLQASFASQLLSLFLEILLLELIGCTERPDRNRFSHRYEEKMYIFIYGLNSLLMLTAFFLLLLCASKYAFLAVFLIIALLVISCVLYQGSALKHTESIKKYREHDTYLNHFSELSSSVVFVVFSGLLSIVFSSPTLPRKNNQIKVTECFLYIITVMSLLLMLLTSVPPAVCHPSTRARMVGVVKYLSYALVGLLNLVGLMVANEILQGIAVLSIAAPIIGAAYWLVTELLYEHADEASTGGAYPASIKEQDNVSKLFATASFATLMFVYSTNVDNKSHNHYFLLVVCMISLCSSFIGCLTKMVLFSYALKTRAWDKGEMFLSFITYFSLVVALLSTFLLALYNGVTSKGSSS